MSITVTKAHLVRMVLQCSENLVKLQLDIRRNAESWKASAQAQSTDAATLAGWMRGACAQYAIRLGWMETLRNDADVYPAFLELANAVGIQEVDYVTLADELAAVVAQLSAADTSTYQAIADACDVVVANVDPPPSVWPE